MTRIDKYGSENFKIDKNTLFNKEWEALLQTRKDMIQTYSNILLKNL